MDGDGMTLRRTLLDKVDRVRDLPSDIRAPLKRALAAVHAAHEEDKEELGLTEPSMESLEGLLRFLSHPYRDNWMPPSLALNPEGHFVAVWDIPPRRYSVEFLTRDSADWIGITRTTDHIERNQGHYEYFDTFQAPPFTIARR
jgi:hypothetical protein